MIDSGFQLRTGEGPGALTVLPTSAQVDKSGRVWVANAQELPIVYTADGRARPVGARGRGPGEYMRVGEIVPLPGDSMLLIDHSEYRATVVAGDLRPARTILLDLVPQRTIVAQWPANVWMAGSWTTPSSAGWPLHRFKLSASASEFVVSFGVGTDELRVGGVTPMFRLAASDGGRVWSMERHTNRLTLWTQHGQPLRTLRRTPAWFKPNANQPMGSATMAPSATVRHVVEDANGYVWLFADTPAPDWSAAWANLVSNAARGGAEVSTRAIATDRLWITRVEVIEGATGRVVAELQMRDWVIAAMPSGHIVTGKLDSLGTPVVHVRRVRLAPPDVPR